MTMPAREPEGVRAPHPLRSALFTDFYELTMASAYSAEGMDRPAAFEAFFRSLPAGRNYALAAGLEDCLAWLEAVRFTPDDLDYLRSLQLFPAVFLGRLRHFRFTGEVWAVPEGTVVFPGEPLIQVVAPILEAQLVETFLLNQIGFQTLAATKAARVVQAARGRPVFDFGARRAQGADAALKAARTCWLAGGVGTSNVLAGRLYGVPVLGTMAHSYIQAHDLETDAFERFAALYPGTTLLVDTYDTLSGVRRVIELAERLGERFRIGAIRLDSGDLAALAVESRRLLDAAGLRDVGIYVSGDLDEWRIRALLDADSPVDGFGVGTRMVVSEDAPALDIAYKLVEYDGRPRLKLTASKRTYPCRKQVWRVTAQGRPVRDLITRFDERPESGEPLLEPVFKDGQRLPAGRRTLGQARERARAALAALPPALLELDKAAAPYPVAVSAALQDEQDRLRREMERDLRPA